MDEHKTKMILIARYLGVAPWDLEQHPEWMEPAWDMMRVSARGKDGLPLMPDLSAIDYFLKTEDVSRPYMELAI